MIRANSVVRIVLGLQILSMHGCKPLIAAGGGQLECSLALVSDDCWKAKKCLFVSASSASTAINSTKVDHLEVRRAAPLSSPAAVRGL